MNFTTPMSNKELKRSEIIVKTLAGELSTVDAAKLAEVSDRTIRRQKAKVRIGGIAALAHQLRCQVGNRRLSRKETDKIKKLLVEKYFDFTPTLAAEKLSELHDLKHDRKTIGRIMVGLGLRNPPRSKGAKIIHRQWREPKARFGEMIQFDGSYHEWLEDRLPGKQCLLGAIDDATSRIVSLSLVADEGVLPVLGFWSKYALKHGLPQAIYVDKFSTYKMTQQVAKENPDLKTQFSRVMETLMVNVIFANSSQAKGRVERLFKTLQDRLVKELRLANVSTVEEADRFMEEIFIPDFNQRFARPARETNDLHRELSKNEKQRINNIFCRHDQRVVAHDFTVSHDNVWYQLEPTPGLAVRPKDKIIVRTHTDDRITLAVRGKTVNYKVISKGLYLTRSKIKVPKTLAYSLVH